MKRLTLAAVAATALMAGTGGALARAAAPTNGCPAGYQLMSVLALTGYGYGAPALVDSPTSGVSSFGKPGNGDGSVCGVQLGKQLTSFGMPAYYFIDDQLPA
jgi:hypothetical protein